MEDSLLEYKEYTEGSKSDVLIYERPDTEVSREKLQENLQQLPDEVFERYLGVSRDDVSLFLFYKRQSDREIWIDHYIQRRYELRNDKEALGRLHHKIDQVYARLTGYRSSFAPVDIPLEEFRIREEVFLEKLNTRMAESVEALYWFTAAALVMYAEKRKREIQAENLRQTGVVERWSKWLQEARSIEGPPAWSEDELQFAENILNDWSRFVSKWDQLDSHYIKYWREISHYQGNDTPHNLYLRAEPEWTEWKKWLGDTTLLDNSRSASGWFKICYRHRLEKMLKATYGDDVDLNILNPDISFQR